MFVFQHLPRHLALAFGAAFRRWFVFHTELCQLLIPRSLLHHQRKPFYPHIHPSVWPNVRVTELYGEHWENGARSCSLPRRRRQRVLPNPYNPRSNKYIRTTLSESHVLDVFQLFRGRPIRTLNTEEHSAASRSPPNRMQTWHSLYSNEIQLQHVMFAQKKESAQKMTRRKLNHAMT